MPTTFKNKLYKHPHLEVRRSSRSPIHKWGVFATKDIKKDQIIEEVPCLPLKIPDEIPKGVLRSYLFPYEIIPSGTSAYGNKEMQYADSCSMLAFVIGSPSLYNTSFSLNDINVDYTIDYDNNIFIFSSINDISANTELLIDYGYHYKENLKKQLSEEWWKNKEKEPKNGTNKRNT